MFNYPKNLHLYWDGSPLSFLNLMTILSFNKFHTGWDILIHMPIIKTDEKRLKKYEGKDYFQKIKSIQNVSIKLVYFNEIGFTNDAPEVIKSDYLRYYVLTKYGGVWSDFDIIYISNLEEKILSENESVLFIDNIGSYKYFPIALFLAKPNNKLFDYILKQINQSFEYNSNSNIDYQVIGSLLFKSLFIDNTKNINLFDVEILNANYYLPINSSEIHLLLGGQKIKLPSNTFGIHWFNGDQRVKTYINELDKRLNSKHFNKINYLDFFVEDYLLFI